MTKTTTTPDQLSPPAIYPINAKTQARPRGVNKAETSGSDASPTPTPTLPPTPSAPVKLPFKTWEGAQEIPVSLLVFCDFNCNEMTSAEFAELMAEIQSGGFDETIQVIPITAGPNAGKYLVLSGEHRTKAMIALGHAFVPAVIKTHLTASDEEALMTWSTKRNNIRGRINAEKFHSLEQKVSAKRKISLEAARQQMLIRSEVIKKINKLHPAPLPAPTPIPSSPPKPLTAPSPPQSLPKAAPTSAAPTHTKASPEPTRAIPPSDPDLDTEDDEDAPTTLTGAAERQRMLANLHTLEQNILTEHGDTIEHGFLFFGQSGKQHLIVEEEAHLYKLVEQMAAACGRNSASMNDFLISAIKKELPAWE